MDGQQKLKAGQGAADRRRRAGLAARRCTWRRPASGTSAWSTSTWSTRPTCSARSSTAPARRQPQARVGRRAAARPQPGRRGHHLRRRGSHRRMRWRSVRRLRHRDRRHRQLPDALPGQRRLRAAGQAERVRLDLPLRGPGVGVLRARTGRATAACIPSRRRPAWCRAAPRAACWACCRASSARSRRPRRSS